MKILKFLFKVIKLWGIKNTFRIILGEVIFLFKDNKFYFEKIKGLNAHIPTPKFVLDEIYYEIKDKVKKNHTIIDFGSGSGRILYYLLNKKYKNLIGVEYSEKLLNISKNNPHFDEKKIKLINKDFTKYKIPKKTRVIFMYDPAGRNVMRKLFENFKKKLSNKCIIIYITPIYLNILKKNNFQIIFKKINKNSRGFVILKKLQI
jgi:predicted RNA methylase